MKISDIDKNFEIKAIEESNGLEFYDVRRPPFCVYGLYDYKNEPQFKRLPDDIAAATSGAVAYLAWQTAGGRVRFSTNSRRIAIKTVMQRVEHFSHMPMSGSAGFDVYVDEPESRLSRHHRTFIPACGMSDGFTSEISFYTTGERYITINFPLYSGVTELYIGIESGSTLGEGAKYRSELPIVYYGSSITQGACASRPGLAYSNIVSQRTWLDHINLGFSGNGRAETAIVDYMAKLPMLAFVSDYDYNAPNADYLSETHCRMYKKIRKQNPDLPYIMLSRCSFDVDYEGSILRRRVVEDTYRYARDNGDNNVYYIDGASIFRGRYEDIATVEGCHPNDVGMILMADAIEAELKRALTQNLL